MNLRLFLIFRLVPVEIVDIKNFVFLWILQLIIGIEGTYGWEEVAAERSE